MMRHDGRATQPGPGRASRLWRLRRRHDHIDALVIRRRSAWHLEFVRNGRLLLTRIHASRDAACAEAGSRRRELERAGWNTHW